MWTAWSPHGHGDMDILVDVDSLEPTWPWRHGHSWSPHGHGDMDILVDVDSLEPTRPWRHGHSWSPHGHGDMDILGAHTAMATWTFLLGNCVGSLSSLCMQLLWGRLTAGINVDEHD